MRARFWAEGEKWGLYNVHDFASYNTVLHRAVDGIGYGDSETGLEVKTKPRHVSG